MWYQLVLHILTCTYSVYCCCIFHFPRQVAKTLSIFRRSNTHNILITEATLFKQGMRATKSNRKYSLSFFFFFFSWKCSWRWWWRWRGRKIQNMYNFVICLKVTVSATEKISRKNFNEPQWISASHRIV